VTRPVRPHPGDARARYRVSAVDGWLRPAIGSDYCESFRYRPHDSVPSNRDTVTVITVTDGHLRDRRTGSRVFRALERGCRGKAAVAGRSVRSYSPKSPGTGFPTPEGLYFFEGLRVVTNSKKNKRKEKMIVQIYFGRRRPADVARYRPTGGVRGG